MKLLLVCIAVVLLASDVEMKKKKKKGSIKDSLQEYLPDLDSPDRTCELQIDGDDIELGEEVCPGTTMSLPETKYKADDSSSLYSFVMLDEGYVVEKGDPDVYPYLLSMIVNIRDLSDLDCGSVVVPYRPPCLTPEAGVKTICITLFKQKDELDASDLDYSRSEFNLAQFSRNNSLCDPVCASTYVVQYPENSEDSCNLD